MPTAGTAEFIKKAGLWIVLLIAAGLILWDVHWILNNEPDHDEVEHWHAAWLMHQGKTPFNDFFEHHSPALWMILRIYYDIFGDNYGIITISRLVMIGVFFLIAFITYRTALFWISPAAAWIAALGFPLLNIGYFMAHVYVRGDPLILLFLMGALYFAVPLAEKRIWDRVDYEKLFLVFALLGLALAISPRAGIPTLSLFLLLGLTCLGILPLLKLIGLFFLGGLVVLLPTIIIALPYGLELYTFWVYKFSALIIPISSPIYGILNIAKSALPVVLLTIAGFYLVLRTPDLRTRRSLWILFPFALINFAGLWACRHPFMQHFLMSVPFLGFFAGFGYDGLVGSLQTRGWLPRWNFAKVAVMLALVLMSVKFYLIWKRQDEANLTAWVKRSQWIMQHAGKGNEFAAGTAFYSPIFLPDAFYYWFAARYTSPTLQMIRKNYEPYTFDQLQSKRPAILHESFAENWYLTSAPEYHHWIETNYRQGLYFQGWYYVRKDIASALERPP